MVKFSILEMAQHLPTAGNEGEKQHIYDISRVHTVADNSYDSKLQIFLAGFGSTFLKTWCYP